MDVEGSRVWFMDLWNYSLVPYILEAVREGLQVQYTQFSFLFKKQSKYIIHLKAKYIHFSAYL